ncbi:hypothetical protein HWV62_14302 [Athelia sp. TMB]|nr:hypothetical protein HWV62_14302 [Athelia sp. TMB]
MPQFVEHFGSLSDFMRGLVVAVILIPSAITGLLAGNLSNHISRKYTIALGSLIFTIGSAISCGSPNLTTLIVARCIAGSGEGLFLSAAAVYLCEICPRHLRAKILTCFQLFNTGAIALGFFVCYGSVKIPSSLSWRLPFAISTFVALLVTVITPFLPYSPRWLVTQGRIEEAEKVLDLITDANDERERRELMMVPPPSDKATWTDIFSKGVRGRTFLGTFLNVIQQLSGIDFVLFYAPLLFAQAGLDANTSSIVASGVTDASGAAYTPAGKWTVIVLIELFAITFAGTWAIYVRLYASEIQPSRTRAAASSFGTGANQLVNTIVALTSPAFLAKSAYGPYFMYGSLVAAGTLVAFVYMPETMGHSLENIDNNFQGSVYAVRWSDLLRRASGINTLRHRRFSRTTRRRMSGRRDDSDRPAIPDRYPMERLASDDLFAIGESAIEE